MRPLSFRPDELRALLLRNKIATLDELKLALGTPVDVTVFRKLKPLDYLTSYSHRGRYYTLREIARFDDYGLWSQVRQCRNRPSGRRRRTVLALTPVALRAPSVRAKTERIRHIPGGARSEHQKGPNQVDKRTSFRHTFGTRLGETGADAFTIMKLMGHSTVTVSQRYVHPSPQAMESAFSRLEAYNTGQPQRVGTKVDTVDMANLVVKAQVV
jgi:integrase